MDGWRKWKLLLIIIFEIHGMFDTSWKVCKVEEVQSDEATWKEQGVHQAWN